MPPFGEKTSRVELTAESGKTCSLDGGAALAAPSRFGISSCGARPPRIALRSIRATALLRGDLHLWRCRADIGVDVAFELHEIVLEHRDELASGLVELCLVLPSLVRIEQMRLDAGELGRH